MSSRLTHRNMYILYRERERVRCIGEGSLAGKGYCIYMWKGLDGPMEGLWKFSCCIYVMCAAQKKKGNRI